jgi:hypothetical protein
MGVDPNASTEGGRSTIRARAWNAHDRLTDAAWAAEERLLWPARRMVGRAKPIARKAGDRAAYRAARSAEPIQRPIQTKLLWPLLDAARSGNPALRIGVVVAAVVAVLGAGTAKSMLSSPPPATPEVVVSSETAVAVTPAVDDAPLRGVSPDFSEGASAAVVAPPKDSAGRKVSLATPAMLAGQPDPAAPPSRVALAFAEAFVAYEVGKADELTTKTFSAVAEDPLAESLVGDPPRLPNGKGVPEAEVLNVVLGKPEGKLVEASVSLVRLRAASELRLTLRDTPDEGWQVSEVLG